MESLPHISVVIPTLNRPADIQRALTSLMAVDYPAWDVTVVDQSDTGDTREIVERARAGIPILRYRHLDHKNCSSARNVGFDETDGEIVAFLDDDCTVGSNWLSESARVLDRHPRAAVVLGELRPANGAPEWSDEGFTPVRHFEDEFEANVAGSLRERARIWPDYVGNGACMLVRRRIVQHVGAFDLNLGGGGRFPACEDGDYVYRILTAGGTIVGAPTVIADHHGLRDYQSGAASRLLRSYEYATAAWFMKVLRLGDICALFWILREYRIALAMVRPLNLIRRRGPAGLVPLVWLTRGLIDSFRLRLDRAQKLYVSARTA